MAEGDPIAKISVRLSCAPRLGSNSGVMKFQPLSASVPLARREPEEVGRHGQGPDIVTRIRQRVPPPSPESERKSSNPLDSPARLVEVLHCAGSRSLVRYQEGLLTSE
jgi:hypothetical protein